MRDKLCGPLRPCASAVNFLGNEHLMYGILSGMTELQSELFSQVSLL
jgi:hypothetical protein